jgi:hypothetical protein
VLIAYSSAQAHRARRKYAMKIDYLTEEFDRRLTLSKEEDIQFKIPFQWIQQTSPSSCSWTLLISSFQQITEISTEKAVCRSSTEVWTVKSTKILLKVQRKGSAILAVPTSVNKRSVSWIWTKTNNVLAWLMTIWKTFVRRILHIWPRNTTSFLLKKGVMPVIKFVRWLGN